MTPEDALAELLECVGAGCGATTMVSDHELSQWPSEATAAMKEQGLLTKASPASSAVCPGCERDCVMPVHTIPVAAGDPALFIVCDKRSDINRVHVPAERLTQWQCTADAVCGFIADSLGLRLSDARSAVESLLEIGMARGDKRTQMLCLQSEGELALVAGSSVIPLAEAIRFIEERYCVDKTQVRQLVDSSTMADNRYTPSTARREARKLETQAMYEGWRKEYRKLKRAKPNMSDSWCAQKVARMEIAKGRNEETIRKNMKK